HTLRGGSSRGRRSTARRNPAPKHNCDPWPTPRFGIVLRGRDGSLAPSSPGDAPNPSYLTKAVRSEPRPGIVLLGRNDLKCFLPRIFHQGFSAALAPFRSEFALGRGGDSCFGAGLGPTIGIRGRFSTSESCFEAGRIVLRGRFPPARIVPRGRNVRAS